jgi:hypothetical protein
MKVDPHRGAIETMRIPVTLPHRCSRDTIRGAACNQRAGTRDGTRFKRTLRLPKTSSVLSSCTPGVNSERLTQGHGRGRGPCRVWALAFGQPVGARCTQVAAASLSAVVMPARGRGVSMSRRERACRMWQVRVPALEADHHQAEGFAQLIVYPTCCKPRAVCRMSSRRTCRQRSRSPVTGLSSTGLV